MKLFNFFHKWLIAGAIILLLMAIWCIFVAALGIELELLTTILFKEGHLPENSKLFYQVTMGISSAMMTGWSFFILILALIPFKRKERWAWFAILTGTLLWYCIDSSFSFYGKIYLNVLFNTIVCVVLLIPLVFTFKEFK